MAGPRDGEELDREIADLKRRLEHAPPGSAIEQELTVSWSPLVSERLEQRLAAGEEQAALDDLETLASHLETVMARTEPASLWFALLCWQAGLTRESRWMVLGQKCDLAAAIEFVGTAATGSAAELVIAARIALARLHSARAQEREPGPARDADLDAAIGHARSGLAALEQERRDQPADFADDRAWLDDADIELRLALGGALHERFSASADAPDPGAGDITVRARAWLDEAISVLRAVNSRIPDADPLARAVAADALGHALHDRYTSPVPGAQADPADLDEAIDTLLASATAAGEPRTIIALIFALSDRLDLRQRAADRDEFIIWCQRLLDLQVPASAEGAFIHKLASDALMERAEADTRTRQADLDAAIIHLETALSGSPGDDPDRTSILTSLAHACWERLGGDASRYDDVDKMTAYAYQAWTALPADDAERIMIGLFYALGTHERLIRPEAAFDHAAVSRAIDTLTEIEPLLADEPSLHLTAMVELGHFLAARGQVTGSRADVSAAEPWLLRAASEVPGSDLESSEIMQNLAVGMTVLANLGMNPDHLDQAIALLSTAASRPHPDQARAAMTTGTQGMLLLQRAGFKGSLDDTNNGVALLAKSFEMCPAGHPYRVAAGINVAGALLTRFLEQGQAEDVDAARFYLNMAETQPEVIGVAVRSLIADADLVVMANKGLLAIADGMLGHPAAFDDAVRCLRSAVGMVPPNHPHSPRIRSDLGMALAYRFMAGRGEPQDLAAAARELAIASAVPGKNVVHPMLLLRTGGVLAAAAEAAADQSLLRQSIGYLTNALSELDRRFGGRFRFAALIGGAQLALHELDQNPASLDSAIAWLREALRELGHNNSHPHYSLCMISLAKAHHARGDAAAIDVGLAALRSRARDLLLQSGTARSLHFARLAAAEATLVAGWCLEYRNHGAAVAALELGRGLILHAATSVNELPELLESAGNTELADEWRSVTSSASGGPWDAGAPGATFVADLLAGGVGLKVPADLRARALGALAESRAMHRLLAPPSPEEVGEALTETGADAVVYLLADSGDAPGRAIIVPAGRGGAMTVAVLPLPSLARDGGDVLREYASTWEAISADSPSADSPAAGQPRDSEAQGNLVPSAAGSEAEARWRSALEVLCEWAWTAAMLPVLGLTAEWRLNRPPRLVLIPTGRLSLVPWHAARSCPEGSGEIRYALREAVISYAASARQLCDVAQRHALPLTASPVIVSDPTRTLPGAQLEARALADQCYPAGQYLGPAWPAWGRAAEGLGTPAEVLRQLPAPDRPGASLLHLGCHGVAVGSAPGRSFLLLAGRRQLRVDTILRQASGRMPRAPGGLISLAACSSDMTPADYDEALTLATAFLAAGAVTVVGARWEIPDGATSMLMYMFHHFMTTTYHGHDTSSRDALRLAQLWMLDNGHRIPDEMPEPLAGYAREWQTAHPAAWAGIVHQGR